MDWFERLTGFRELDPEASHARAPARRGRAARLARERQSPRDRPTGAASLRELRRGVADAGSAPRGSTVRNGVGDVRALHRAPEFEGALFRVASQFNLPEMVSPGVSPEDGVTRYMHDPTQGPACAIAAGAATVYRNYFVPVGEACGQTAARQLDALAPLGAALAGRLGRPVSSLWSMRNGYALCTPEGLDAIAALLRSTGEAERDALRAELCIGVRHDVEVTDAPGPRRPRVAQAFCSALPVAYSRLARRAWEPFARAGAGGGLRGDPAGGLRAPPGGRLVHRPADAAGRRRLRQRRRVDRRRDRPRAPAGGVSGAGREAGASRPRDIDDAGAGACRGLSGLRTAVRDATCRTATGLCAARSPARPQPHRPHRPRRPASRGVDL